MTWKTPVVGWLVATLAVATTAPSQSTDLDSNALIAQGDRAWARRAEGHQGSRAEPGPIAAAVGAYQQTLEKGSENLEARVKLMKALYFQGEHATSDPNRRLELYQRGRELGEEGIDLLGRSFNGEMRPALKKDPIPRELIAHLSQEPQAKGVYLWNAVHWGLWGRQRGKLAAARQGVAGKIRDYSKIVAALDRNYESGAAHRMLGRLHSEAPKLPLITGWVDRQIAISELEKAVEVAPDNLLNQLFLIEALLEFDRNRRDEAMERLRRLVRNDPDPSQLVEEIQALDDARLLLAEFSR